MCLLVTNVFNSMKNKKGTLVFVVLWFRIKPVKAWQNCFVVLPCQSIGNLTIGAVSLKYCVFRFISQKNYIVFVSFSFQVKITSLWGGEVGSKLHYRRLKQYFGWWQQSTWRYNFIIAKLMQFCPSFQCAPLSFFIPGKPFKAWYAM